MGRVRLRKWGPRLIDVDVLAYRDQVIDEPDLKVPHPLIAERGFVVLPLKEIAPSLSIRGQSLDQMLERLDTADLEAL
jgi:2-amino-4-hydroxy-6-hydroxymethyldihydropteridine diphosphokinase